MDESTLPAVLDDVQAEVATLAEWLASTPELDLAAAETAMLQVMRRLGSQLLEAGLAARSAGRPHERAVCACGEPLHLEGYRPKEVQTLLGWITLRRTYYCCAGCGSRHRPLDGQLGLLRDSHSPGVRRLASRLGAQLPFAPAAATLAETAGVQLSTSTVRTLTMQSGAAREQALSRQVAAAWEQGWEAVSGEPPARCYVAMDGVRILSTDGQGREVKVGMVVPVGQTAAGEQRGAARYTASLEPADAVGQRLALLARAQQGDQAAAVAVLGDGAAWILNLAETHFPDAVQIVDWFHASERVWELGRALYGRETAATQTWVTEQLARLAAGEAALLAEEWQQLSCQGEAALIRDGQVTYFTNQAERMAYDQYRAAGWDIGSGMIESACKRLIGQRHKGSGMRWSDAGAQAVANVRLLLSMMNGPIIGPKPDFRQFPIAPKGVLSDLTERPHPGMILSCGCGQCPAPRSCNLGTGVPVSTHLYIHHKGGNFKPSRFVVSASVPPNHRIALAEVNGAGAPGLARRELPATTATATGG
jgi:hypothetical protein